MTVPPPTRDGELNYYVNPQASSTRWYSSSRTVVFVNGMLNSPSDHVESALALSLLQMCRVAGIYNLSRVSNPRAWATARAVVEDLAQCLADKFQWDSHGADRLAVNLNSWFQANFGSTGRSVQYVEGWLARNPPALTLFRYIRSRPNRPLTIFAHSQGNLITSNALTALSLLSPAALGYLTVNSYASPSVFWPAGFTHHSYAYTLDLVPLVAGFGNSLTLRTSTIGGLGGVASHGFENYRRDDPTFVVNQFRWGALRMTISLDESGLANALVAMAQNMPRIYNIFVRLDEVHNSDVDDVALLYIQRIRRRPDILAAVRAHDALRRLLIRSLDEDWTTSAEYAAIAVLEE